MKLIQAIAVTVLAVSLVACQKPKQVQPETPAPAATTEAAATTSGLGTQSAGAGGTTKPLTAQQQALAALGAKNVVYFAYDSSEIRSDDVAVVTAQAAYLVKYRTAHVRLEGHTDQRGSREYNIGLGERRAQSVRKALLLQGVGDAQITTVSYGAERPAVEGSDEAAYAKNRRVEFVPVQ